MDRIGRVVWIDYSQHHEYGLVARTSLRFSNGDRKDYYITDVEPWFFAPANEPAPDSDSIVDIESGYQSIYGDPLKKITTEHPQDTNDIKDSFSKTFESDLPFYRKLSIHDGLSGYIEVPEEYYDCEVISADNLNTEVNSEEDIIPRVLMADIEVTIGDDSFEETKENNSEPIIAISTYDTYDEEYQVFFYDGHESLEDGSQVREYLEEHWQDERGDIEVELVASPTEEAMLQKFFDYVEEVDSDLLSGWNWLGYDHEYIIGRSKKIGVPINNICSFNSSVGGFATERKITGRPGFDLMDAFDKMTFKNWRSMALDYIAEDQLGVGKVDDVSINDSWENNPEKLIAYNIIDTQLLVELNEVNSIVSFFYDLADMSSIPIWDTFSELRLVDGFIMSRRGDDAILPEATKEDLEDNAGGFVGNAVSGVYENVGVVDLTSLYPSCMITFNISSETMYTEPPEDEDYITIPKVPEPKSVEGQIQERDIKWDWVYCSIEEQGIIPENVKLLFNKRNRAKDKRNQYKAGTQQYESYDRQQGAIKVIMNSFFGVSASPYWRLAIDKIGGAITSSARYVLWKGIQSCHNHGYETLYQDTDSNFVLMGSREPEKAVEEGQKLERLLNDDMSEIAEEVGYEGDNPFLVDENLHGDNVTCFTWDFEKCYKKFVQVGTKKRYAGSIFYKDGNWLDKPKIDIMGLESQRSDSPEITSELQEEIIRLILSDASFDDVSSYIRSIIDEIHENNEDVKKFALPGSINKALEDYPNREIPRACMWSNEHLDREFTEGDDPFVYYVEETPSHLPQTDVVALEWNEEIPDGFKLDKEAIIRRAIRKPIEPIIAEAGYEFSELRSGREQNTFDIEDDSSDNPFA